MFKKNITEIKENYYKSMELINEYFRSLIFTKVDEKQATNGRSYAIYGAGISGMFGDGSANYILLFVPSELATKRQGRIKELRWENLQTRKLQHRYNLKKQSWRPSRNLHDPLLSVQKRETNISVYTGPIPFEILLIHDPKRKTIYQFSNHINLSSALETFSAVLNYTGNFTPIQYTSNLESPLPQDDFNDSYELISS